MTQNLTGVWSEILPIVAGAAVLLLFALGVAWPHRPRVLPGSQGHRERDDEEEHELIQPDGYIDSFAGDIEEAGGGLPWLVRLAFPGIIIWWLVYLILNWTQR